MTTEPWERQAANWVAWTRTPGHDVFPHFAAAFFDEIVPPPHGRTLEVGCGEGRVIRTLAARGHRAIGVDASPTLVRAAVDADTTSTYLSGDATALPFADATFGTVIAYNSLQTMLEWGDMARSVREAARVLEPSGRFCLCVAHPMTNVGRLKGHGDDADLVITGSYFERSPVNETVTRDGLQMTFHGWTYTLEDYVRALEDAGLLIERIREPRPAADNSAARPSRWHRVPLFLSIRAFKPAP